MGAISSDPTTYAHEGHSFEIVDSDLGEDSELSATSSRTSPAGSATSRRQRKYLTTAVRAGGRRVSPPFRWLTRTGAVRPSVGVVAKQDKTAYAVCAVLRTSWRTASVDLTAGRDASSGSAMGGKNQILCFERAAGLVRHCRSGTDPAMVRLGIPKLGRPYCRFAER